MVALWSPGSRSDDAAVDDTGPDADSPEDGFDSSLTRIVRWVLLYGDRRVLALLTVLIILTTLLTIGTVWEFEMERLVTETRAVQTLFNTLLGGIILFISVVLSINTAALAQEFAPLQVKLARIEDSIEFQVELKELVDEGVSPAGLRPFLKYVIGAVHAETASLQAVDDSSGDEDARGDLRAFVIALSPYVLLSSYMLRILTVSRHSLESTVFTLDADAEPGVDR